MERSPNDVLTSIDRRALKVGTQNGVGALGGVHSAAEHLRTAACHLSEQQNFRHENKFMAVDDVARLERLTGQPFVTATLAKLGGWRLVDAGDGSVCADPEGDSLSECLDLFPTLSRVVDAVKAARHQDSPAGAQWSEGELQRLMALRAEFDREFDELIAAAERESAVQPLRRAS